MAIEIPVFCQGKEVLIKGEFFNLTNQVVNVRIEMIGLCKKLGEGNRCDISGENCIFKAKKTIFSSGLGDGDEEFID